jgi:hypothetical protein
MSFRVSDVRSQAYMENDDERQGLQLNTKKQLFALAYLKRYTLRSLSRPTENPGGKKRVFFTSD